MYRLEGDKWIIKIDVAWPPERIGIEEEPARAFSDFTLTYNLPTK